MGKNDKSVEKYLLSQIRIIIVIDGESILRPECCFCVNLKCIDGKQSGAGGKTQRRNSNYIGSYNQNGRSVTVFTCK